MPAKCVYCVNTATKSLWDATNLELLRAAGVEQAEALVVCTDDPEQVITIVELCQQHFPNLKLLA